MPPSLLEQSRETLRATFSSIVKKRIYTLNYDRSSDMTWATVQKLRAARRHCGVLLCSASTIKSVELKLLEALDTLADPRRVQSLSSERQVKTIKGALDIFATGVLVMDEVDLLLHPLKSELNFPLGQKHPLDFSPERWQCAIHGLDAIFYHASKAMSVPFHQSGRAHAILDELSTIIDAGFDEQQLQRSPHLVLLSPEWYQHNLKPVMAKWMLLWLEANHLCTRLSQQQLVAYLVSDGAGLVGPDAGGAAAARALEELHASMARSNIDTKSFQLLNLCSDWLRVFLPHVLQKIDRVSFGLLSVPILTLTLTLTPNP